MLEQQSSPELINFNKLKLKLRELFELDKADLDFGIYRILRQRHAEITEFLDRHLEKTVTEALLSHVSVRRVHFEEDLKEAEKAAAAAGIAPEQSPRVMELRAKAKGDFDLVATADEVYSHLLAFFSRYYQGGDFLGLHRTTVHGREKYMIPYNGEEVKLVWANMDQYYIKSSELLRDYTFRIRKADFATGELNLDDLPAESVVRFKLVEGDTEKDNRKPDGKTTRAFALDEEKPFEEDGDTLAIRFRYREHTSERNLQDKLNADTEKALADSLTPRWNALLFAADATHQPKDKKDTRTVLQKHLRGYTAKYLFDYFIHKDLGGFLRRELDFYVKNEVMHLDDIEDTAAPKAEEYLSKIRAIRRCAMPIIQMIAQLEEFQKRLWLKKKFVIETRYCLTLDRVPETLYLDICTADAQWQEWDELVALSELKPRRTPEFLKSHPYLMIDTRHFSHEFTLKLLASIENLDANLDGVCFHSENFQALQLMRERYREQVKCVYIDPPYNAQSSAIIYKNSYKHSSWLSLIQDRVTSAKPLCTDQFVFITAIDEVENFRLGMLLEGLFPNCEDACISILHNPTGQQGDNFSYTHEFAHFLYPQGHKCIGLEDREDISRESEPDIRPLRNVSSGPNHFRESAATCFYPILIKDGKIIGFGDVCPDSFHPTSINILREDGVIEVYPIDPSGKESKWVFARDTVESIINELSSEYNDKKKIWDIIRKKTKFRYKSLWEDKRYSANSWGSVILNNMLPNTHFTYPKSIYTVSDSIDAGMKNEPDGIVLDFFAGSGTTGHAVILLNRQRGGRKYILVEMGQYFDTDLIPRLKKAAYSTDWKEGKPQKRDTGISHCFKIVRLEGYEDTLNNLHLHRTPEQSAALAQGTETNRDQYLLGYFLDLESAGSKSLLSLSAFRDPFSYKLQIATSSAGETKEANVDLVETFNWLLGLKVRHIDAAKGFLTVTGEKRAGGRCLTLWRTLSADTKADNEALEKFLTKLAVNPADTEFEFIYVNGPHTLNDPHNKVHLIEETFQRLMFDTTNFESLG
jgi:adenine-specific DNA-methyltransferase